MTLRRWHRLLGLVMLLPLCGWIVTGVIFFVKPGYAGAYDTPAPRTYAGLTPASSAPKGALEMRSLRTVLGDHLLVKTADGWTHYDPATLRPRQAPSPADVRRLLEDAVSDNKPRYGSIVSVDGLTAHTSTGVTIDLDWNTLSLQQRGTDTDRIDLFYRIHYLQWTGVKLLDRILGIAGLTLLLALTVLGFRLAFRPDRTG
jgi:PepSY-associated transmembrane protein